jgi:hypothetical protein
VRVSSSVIGTTPVDLSAAASIEAAEARAWSDLYAAAPADWAAGVGLATQEVGGGALVLRWAATGRRYFSRVIGLGVAELARPEVIDEILIAYEEAGITMFLLQSQPHCQPGQYEGWLRERGLEPFDAQDRVLRDGIPLVAPRVAMDRELTIERVTRETATEWVEFLERVYRLDTGPWLPNLIGRACWHQYLAREDGIIVGARGMHIGTDGTAWLGMDGPVPGVATDDYEPDAALCAFIVADGPPTAPADSSLTSSCRRPTKRLPRTRASVGSGSRSRMSARTGRGADARLDLEVCRQPGRTALPLRRDGGRDPGGELTTAPLPPHCGRNRARRHMPDA